MDLDAPIREAFEQLPRILMAELGEERAAKLAKQAPDELEELIRDAVTDATQKVGRDLAEDLKADGPAMLARRRAERRLFEQWLARRWGAAV